MQRFRYYGVLAPCSLINCPYVQIWGKIINTGKLAFALSGLKTSIIINTGLRPVLLLMPFQGK